MRETVFIIEIAFRAEKIVFFSENTAEHAPGARLSDASDDGEDGYAALCAHVRGKLLHGNTGIAHPDMGIAYADLAHNTCRSAVHRCRDETVSVDMLAVKRNKKGTGRNLAAVDCDTADSLKKNIPIGAQQASACYRCFSDG